MFVVTEGLRVVEARIPVENDEILVKAFIPLASSEAENEGFPLLFYIYGGGTHRDTKTRFGGLMGPRK